MHWLLNDLYNFGMAVGPVMGYVYQYKLIHERKSVGSFSINLCGLLLFCNILRIGFYLFQQYSLALLIQSFLMIIVQIFLLKKCVETMVEEGKFSENEGVYDEDNIDLVSNFWNWSIFRKYLIVIGLFFCAVLFLSGVFSHLEMKAIGELIGYLSLISQSLLMLPQVLQNQKQRRVKGLSHLLVAFNNIGDLFKLYFFFINNQPSQFILCGIIQVFIDGYVIIQICYFGNGDSKDEEKDENKETNPSEKKGATEQKFGEIIEIPKTSKEDENYKQFQDEPAD